MLQSSLFLKITEQWKKELPFVLFAMPNESFCSLFYQNNSTLHTTETYKESGFVMAPFNFSGKSFFIPQTHKIVESLNVTYVEQEKVNIPKQFITSEKEQHIHLVEAILEQINTGEVVKVVASRKKKITLLNTDLELIASRLLQSDTSAFRYMWYHPDTGLWFGASPEILVKMDGKLFSTMSLAGTKKAIKGEQPQWTPKEVLEQKIVTDTIITKLQNITAAIKVTKPFSVKAGLLFHLKTEISGNIKKNDNTLFKIITALHPTPAVCGEPTKAAQKLISELENYDREFYTGFLGPVNQAENTTTIFVNLRSAKIEKNIASIYVGGGIVQGSNPEDEWEETENKLSTMENVLAPLLKY